MSAAAATPVRAEVVQDPRGGQCLAVPVGNGSTVRIYQGWRPLGRRSAIVRGRRVRA
jgi:hypothetical protein